MYIIRMFYKINQLIIKVKDNNIQNSNDNKLRLLIKYKIQIKDKYLHKLRIQTKHTKNLKKRHLAEKV